MREYTKFIFLLCCSTVLHLRCNLPSVQDKLQSMGLVESVLGRNEVHKAMVIVNYLIKAKQIPDVLCGWDSKTFENNRQYYFLIQPDGLPFNSVAQSSKENNSIFISSSWRSICDQTFRLSDNDSLLRVDALVLVLLHELGHNVNNKNYFMVEGTNIKLDSMLFRNRQLMNDEIQADFFAAEIVKKSKSQDGKRLKKSVEQLYSKVDEYFYWKYGLHGSPLRMMLSEPEKRFSDFSFTHPNLNLRLHLLSYLVNPTEDKLKRIKWLQEQRKIFLSTNRSTPDVIDKLIYLKTIISRDSITK